MFGKDYMPKRVSRAMAYLKLQLADVEHLAMLDKSGRFWRIFVFHPERRELMRLHTHKQRLLRQRCV